MPLFLGLFGQAPDLLTLESKRDIEGLKQLLAQGNNRAVKVGAAEALGKIGNAGAVDSLLAVLEHDDDEVRMFAAIALGKIGDSRAVDPLIATLGDRHHEVRGSAALALGLLRDSRAVDPLMNLSADPFEEVRRAAEEALDNISEECGGGSGPFCGLKL